jgi:hypothetical protein
MGGGGLQLSSKKFREIYSSGRELRNLFVILVTTGI